MALESHTIRSVRQRPIDDDSVSVLGEPVV